MNRKMCVRLAAFVSVLLLLVVSIPPVLAAPLDDLTAVNITISRIHGATSIFADGHAEGQFVIQLPPDPVRPSLVLTSEEGRVECTDTEQLRFVITGRFIEPAEGGNDGLFTMTATPSSRSAAGDGFFDIAFEIFHEAETLVIQFDNVPVRITPSDPCQR